MFIKEKRYTIAEYGAYAAQYPEQLLELVNGRIVEKVVGRKHGKIVLKSVRVWWHGAKAIRLRALWNRSASSHQK